MSETREFIAKVGEGGILPEHTRKSLGIVFRGYSGKVIRISIKLQALRRSSRQNSYYWSVVVPHWKMIFKDSGAPQNDDYIHDYLVQEVAKMMKPVIGPDGNEMKRYTKLEEECLTLLEEMILMDANGDRWFKKWCKRAKDLLAKGAEMTQPVMMPVSTADLTTKQFSEFVELCRIEAATEHNHEIPPPKEN